MRAPRAEDSPLRSRAGSRFCSSNTRPSRCSPRSEQIRGRSSSSTWGGRSLLSPSAALSSARGRNVVVARLRPEISTTSEPTFGRVRSARNSDLLRLFFFLSGRRRLGRGGRFHSCRGFLRRFRFRRRFRRWRCCLRVYRRSLHVVLHRYIGIFGDVAFDLGVRVPCELQFLLSSIDRKRRLTHFCHFAFDLITGRERSPGQRKANGDNQTKCGVGSHRPASKRHPPVAVQDFNCVKRRSCGGMRSVASLKYWTTRRSSLHHSFGGSGMVLRPTLARYSSAWRRSLPARSTILSKLSIDETSSSCSVRNHCRKLIVM